MNIKLLGDRLLIEQVEEEQKTASGIIIKKEITDIDDILVGKVVAVGPGKTVQGEGLVPVAVKVEDKVMFQYGKKVIVEGKVYLLVLESDVIMIV